MTSPFEKAEKVDSYLKLFIWGESGAGKTTLALQFPDVVVIDMEKGTAQYGDKFTFAVTNTNKANEADKAVEWLLHNKHPYKTLVVDPITIYWDSLQTKWSEILLASDGKGIKGKGEHQFYDFQPKDWMVIKAEYKEFMRKLLDLDMNVIITAHGKTNYKDGQFMQAAGKTFDTEKKTAYLFDVVLELYIESGKRWAFCHKDRTGKLPTEPFEVNYEAMTKYFGKDTLERPAQPVRLVTSDEALDFQELCTRKGIPQTRIEEKLQKEAGVISLEELPYTTLQKWIEKLQGVKDK